MNVVMLLVSLVGINLCAPVAEDSALLRWLPLPWLWLAGFAALGVAGLCGIILGAP